MNPWIESSWGMSPNVAKLQLASFLLPLDKPLVMGIVNVTPDSFSDGGVHHDPERAIAHAHALIEAGADILDIGGESSRPGAKTVHEDEEWRRVAPVLHGLAACGRPLSLDTTKISVMRRALTETKVAMINDINAFSDPEALALVAPYSVGLCLMHKQGSSETMQQSPHYVDVVDTVHSYLQSRLAACAHHGIAANRLLVDVGFGFGKTRDHNWRLLRSLPDICPGVPHLVGLSRKSMLADESGQPPPSQRLAASLAAHVLAVQQGAKVLRVHDVAETRSLLRILASFDATATHAE